LAEAGADIAIHHFGPREQADAVADACRAAGRRTAIVLADFARDPGSAAAFVDESVRQLGRVDVLVNNAGVTSKREPFETHSRALFEEIMAVNVTAAFLASQAAARHMIERGEGGRIINIGSVHARMSAPQRTAYETSKGALHALTFSTAVALGRYGITVNCVAPGAIQVETNVGVFDLDWYVSRTPIGRLGDAADVAAAVLFLASADAGFITGETLVVDGGMTRRMALVK
jgi:NAD(P)-dependent dehydrogenase (short-subunit alcohol dehydrogenase family)